MAHLTFVFYPFGCSDVLSSRVNGNKEKLGVLKQSDNDENVFKLATELGVGKAACDWEKNQMKLVQSCAMSLGENTLNWADSETAPVW